KAPRGGGGKDHRFNSPKEKPTATAKGASTNGKDKPQITPSNGEPTIEASTIKVIKTKMEGAALSDKDFTKRFPAFATVDDPISAIKRTDVNPVINWLADPVNK